MPDFSEIISTAKLAAAPNLIRESIDGVDVKLVACADGSRTMLTDLRAYTEKLLPRPRRKIGTAKFDRLADHLLYARTHAPQIIAGAIGSNEKGAKESALAQHGVLDKSDPVFRPDGAAVNFISVSSGIVTTVLNYHQAGANGQQHGDFRAIYTPVFSKEWEAWTEETFGTQGGMMSVGEFAEFIEDHIEDVIDFDAAEKTDAATTIKALAKMYGLTIADRGEVLTQSKGMKIKVTERVGQIVDLDSGAMQIEYQSEHANAEGKSLKFHGMFVIAIPVFEGGAVFRLAVRLKYRVEGGKLLFQAKLIGEDKAKETAIEAIRKDVAETTGFQTFYGSPA